MKLLLVPSVLKTDLLTGERTACVAAEFGRLIVPEKRSKPPEQLHRN